MEDHYPKTIKLSIPSLTYIQNEEELQLASYSEQMRLLYVAMTRAEKKLILSARVRVKSWNPRNTQQPKMGN